jgi:hypothetical protein
MRFSTRAASPAPGSQASDHPDHVQLTARSNNEAEQVIRMSKLRIKVSGCMRSMHGAEAFCAIRSYLATATRHGISWLDALTQAAAGTPWIPGAT